MKNFFKDNTIVQKLRNYLTNKFVLVIIGFIIYMSFFDQYRWIDMINYHKEIKVLKDKQYFYKTQIKQIDESTKNILTDKDQLEKYAREKFLMKRKDEILFLIDEDKL